MQIVLAGNPNAGKTTLFNALTHSKLKTGNWHGVTTENFTKKIGGVTYVDSPGLYSFDGYTMEEKAAQEGVKGADLIVNVADSLTLENALKLTRKLLAINGNLALYLTKTRRLKARGGWLDAEKLQRLVGVPVYDCTPRQLKKLIDSGEVARAVREAANRRTPGVQAPDFRLDDAYYCGDGALNRAEKLFYNKYAAPVIFVLSMVLTFFITFHPIMPGAALKSLVSYLVCDLFSGAVRGVMTNGIAASFVCDGIIDGVGGVLSFIPQLAVLYLALILLDESGVMSALSFVTDGIFERANLSGRAAFSLISGFGCTAAAISTTRGYVSKSAQRRTVAILPYVPCGAKLPVFLTFLSPIFSNPFPAVCILYFCGIALSVGLSLIIKGDGEGLISEIAPVSLPQFSAVKNKLFFQLQSFIIKVTTYVAVFCAVSWFLSHFSFTMQYVEVQGSMLCALSKIILPLFYPMGITDWRIAYAMVTGFAAKENVAATISMLMPEGINLAFAPSMSACAFVLCCPACISAFAASSKEIGLKTTVKYNLLQLAFAFAFAYLTNLLFLLL
ncbi:MAG: FeoB small GTPase domain-containing protein [Candidatus Coproplasma sp.]